MKARNRAGKRIRLQDVADEVGVSVNTVSRALTGKFDVSVVTRERVKAVAARLGYTPNVLARSLVQGATRTVGLIVTDCTAPYYSLLIRAIESVTSDAGFGLLLATSNDDVNKERAALTMLRERCVDGILLTPVDVRSQHVRSMVDDPVPVVLLTRRPTGYPGPFVGPDNVLCARLAVRHLVESGHRRIAHLGRSDPVSSARERLRGWRSELRAHGLTAENTLIHRTAHTAEAGREAATWLLGIEPRPSAVFCYSDVLAIGLISGLHDAKIAVPRQISVIGCDDIPLGALVTPTLTTVAQGIGDIGQLGADILIGRINGDRQPQESVVLRPRLVKRSSVAPPQGRRLETRAVDRTTS